jgi:GTP:adenosylcobinamide-phosphate guanylyltransferase
MIEVHGKPMAQWVLNALTASPSVGDIYMMGLTEDIGLISTKKLHFMAGGNTMFENIRTGVLQSAKDHPDRAKVLLVSVDIPAVTPQMIEWLTEQISLNPESWIYYNVVSQETMESRYPNSNRSYVRFRDISVCGGDLNAVDTNLFLAEQPVWKKLTEARKHPLQQALLLGLGNLALVALHLATLETIVKRISHRLSIDARALLCPYAEMAMDADKPHQLAILREDLGKPG